MMDRQKKPYKPPDLKRQKITIQNDVLRASDVENFSSYIDEGGDWGDPIFDPDDEIIW